MHRQGNNYKAIHSFHRARLIKSEVYKGKSVQVEKLAQIYHSQSLHLFTYVPAHCNPVETRVVGFELSNWALQILSELMSVQNIKLLLQRE